MSGTEAGRVDRTMTLEGPAGAPSAAGASVGGTRAGGSRWAAPMALALEAARAAAVHGDVPIGAVLLSPEGTVVASAGNKRELTGDPTAHAEVLVLRQRAAELGSWRLDGHTLVVTLEPCTMCAGAAVLARVDRIVFGAWEPRTGAVGSLWDVVRDRRLTHRPEVVGGVREVECSQVLLDFFATHRV